MFHVDFPVDTSRIGIIT